MKPTFLTMKVDLAFRNGNFNVGHWQAFLNGKPVTAVEADTERGYVDVWHAKGFLPGMRTVPIHRLFGRVELRDTSGFWHDHQTDSVAYLSQSVGRGTRQTVGKTDS